MPDIRFGAAFPTGMEGMMYPVPFCDPEDLVDIATTAEALGFDSIGGNDHIVTQEYVKRSWDDPPRFYEFFGTFSYVAAETSTIRLNTAVTVLPFREPVWVAKQAATLDRLSGGRLLFGVGVGAYREEFEAVRPDETARRGAIMDESVEALAALLSGPASYDGEHVRFEDVDLYPRPAQDPLPIYVGVNHRNAMKRAVRWGHGWLPAGLTPAEIEDRTDDLAALCAEHGRDPDGIDVAPQLLGAIDTDGDAARRTFRGSQAFEHIRSLSESTLKEQSVDAVVEENLIGSPDEVIRTVQRFVDAGVEHFPAVIFAANDVEELTGQMRTFAETVLPSFE